MRSYKRFYQKGYTLLELLVVLSIFGVMFMVVAGGVVQFRQTIIVSNTSKELLLNLRKARRDALGNVITSEGYTPQGYYISLDTSGSEDTYYLGECIEASCNTLTDKPLMSPEFTGVEISPCHEGANDYKYIKFNHVNGEFIFSSTNNVNTLRTESTTIDTCTIDIWIAGTLSTTRTIEVNGLERTIKMKND